MTPKLTDQQSALGSELDSYQELPRKEKRAKCDELSGVFYKDICYTFEGQIYGLVEENDDGDDIYGVIHMKECPGGCAIWALLCAPSTYSDFCLHAYNQERDA